MRRGIPDSRSSKDWRVSSAPGQTTQPWQAGAWLGVTIISPSYQEAGAEAVRRWKQYTGNPVLVIHAEAEPAFSVKLHLDELCPARPIVFFDADLWLLRPLPFEQLDPVMWSAVGDPGVWNPGAFPHSDCRSFDLDSTRYFNSGLMALDLGNMDHRAIFSAAREKLKQVHSGKAEKPVDWTDQFFLNAAFQASNLPLHLLPFAWNFYRFAVQEGSFPHIPRDIIGLHAAGVPVAEKLTALQAQALAYSMPERPMWPAAMDHYNSTK